MSRINYLEKFIKKELERISDLASVLKEADLGTMYVYAQGDLRPTKIIVKDGQLNIYDLLAETLCSNACSIFEISDKLKEKVIWKKKGDKNV